MNITTWFFGVGIIVVCVLAVALPLVSEAWDARPAARRTREAEAERSAQSEALRIRRIGEERAARARYTRDVLLAIAEGIAASTRDLPPLSPMGKLPQEDRQTLFAQRPKGPLDPERVERNLAGFCSDVALRIAPRLLEETHSPERVLAYRAALRRAEIAAFVRAQAGEEPANHADFG